MTKMWIVFGVLRLVLQFFEIKTCFGDQFSNENVFAIFLEELVINSMKS